MTSIVVDYFALLGTARGGADILSYELQWDAGTTALSVTITWLELVGFTPDSLLN